MLSISTVPQKISNGTKQYRFYFTHPELSKDIYIGSLHHSELYEGRFPFLKKIYSRLEECGFEPDSVQHTYSMVSFFAELDKILVPAAAESAKV